MPDPTSSPKDESAGMSISLDLAEEALRDFFIEVPDDYCSTYDGSGYFSVGFDEKHVALFIEHLRERGLAIVDNSCPKDESAMTAEALAVLDEEWLNLSRSSIDNGCADCGIASNTIDKVRVVIEALTAERDQLREQLNTCRELLHQSNRMGVQTDADNTRLRERNEAMEKALREVITNGRWTEGEGCGEWAITLEVYAVANDELFALDCAALSPADKVVETHKPTRLENFASFVVTWTHRPNVTDAERLSAIKFHPVVQQAAREMRKDVEAAALPSPPTSGGWE